MRVRIISYKKEEIIDIIEVDVVDMKFFVNDRTQEIKDNYITRFIVETI